jgi:NTP pyrophosphatase (non-canonical NTP hydrolase)
MMTLSIEEYEAKAQRTMGAHTSDAERLVNAALGLAGESGEFAEIIGVAVDADATVVAALQLAILSGQVCDLVKKDRFHARPIDRDMLYLWLAEIRDLASSLWDDQARAIAFVAPLATEHLKEELGDAGWYLTQACTGAHLSLADVLAANNRKLAARYQAGFSAEASARRDVAREQSAIRGDE